MHACENPFALIWWRESMEAAQEGHSEPGAIPDGVDVQRGDRHAAVKRGGWNDARTV